MGVYIQTGVGELGVANASATIKVKITDGNGTLRVPYTDNTGVTITQIKDDANNNSGGFQVSYNADTSWPLPHIINVSAGSGQVTNIVIGQDRAAQIASGWTTPQAIWDSLTSALSTVGSVGKLLVDNINATIGSRAIAGDAMALTISERNSIAAVVWSSLVSGITTANSIGKRLIDNLTGDIFGRLGTPAGATISADVAAIKAQTVLIQAQTDKFSGSTTQQMTLQRAISTNGISLSGTTLTVLADDGTTPLATFTLTPISGNAGYSGRARTS